MIASLSTKVMLVERDNSGMSATAYKDRMEAVLGMIDNGSLGGGVGYGCDEHKAALDTIERHIAMTRQHILEQEAQEKNHD